MKNKFQICKETIDNKINNREEFSWEGIQQEIVDKGGVLWLGPGTSLGDYVCKLEKHRIIAYNPWTKKYITLEQSFL